MKVLKELYPYRIVERSSDQVIEKYDPVTKRYSTMYVFGCTHQTLTALEDHEYVKWLCQDPCYLRDTVANPYK